MSKLLTLAIPTYNRATELKRQLAWIAQEIKGFESECEIFISDNDSTDNTQEVVEKWQKLFNTELIYHKNKTNIGLIQNIGCCLQASKTKYIWTIGDDDPIQDGTLAYVVRNLQQNPRLSLLFLNFSGRNKQTNEVVGEHWFEVDKEEVSYDGKAVFERCLETGLGGVIFLTASVYKTDLVQTALQKWPASVDNWIALAYWSGFCAAHGSVLITKDNYLECIIGVSYWQKDPSVTLKTQFKERFEVFLKLRDIAGYSDLFCNRMILRYVKDAQLKAFLGALRRWPLRTVTTIIPFIGLVSGAFIGLAGGSLVEGIASRIEVTNTREVASIKNK